MPGAACVVRDAATRAAPHPHVTSRHTFIYSTDLTYVIFAKYSRLNDETADDYH